MIDTNVLLVANGNASHLSDFERIQCVRYLKDFREKRWCYVVDGSFEIINEYFRKLEPRKEPYWNSVLKHIMQNLSNTLVVEQVTITKSGTDWYSEIDSQLTSSILHDPSDRKFVAVQHAHGKSPPIVNACDGDWKEIQDKITLIWLDSDLLKVEQVFP